MTHAQVIAELVRRYPQGERFQARETAALPGNPGWRCMVSVWNANTTPRTNVFGRGDTFEGALADAERREALPRAAA